jgi:lysophospholipase L1-like esterase
MNVKRKQVIISIIVVFLLINFAGLVITGRNTGWGPFGRLHSYDGEVTSITEKYNAATRQHEIVFYGASNFRLWYEMENDLAQYKIQNHGFGGSTDKLLVRYAPQLLYSYEPAIVFFQTGSNDYVGLSGTDDEKVQVCMTFKKEMFETFHRRLPEAQFVVMSGLLLPGRSRYTVLSQKINAELKKLCKENDYMYFVDASSMTYDGTTYAKGLFVKDGIHLNRGGQKLWCEQYIRPKLDALITEYDLTHLRKGNSNFMHVSRQEETMKRLDGFKAGVNLGHWLSQNGGDKTRKYFDRYITEDDIKRIASWGMDHVRLPVDYHFFEKERGMYDEERLGYIDRCLHWCKKAGLNMILDLHEAPDYSFFNSNETDRAAAFAGDKSNTMFTDENLKARFIEIWKMFARRYRAEGRGLIFELLNEIVLSDIFQWNALWKETLSAIRGIDPDRTVVIGGNRNSDVSELRNLDLVDDEGVVYTFHFYEPGIFTHQKAPFIPYLANYPVPVTYPFTRSQHQAFFDAVAAQGMVPSEYNREDFGKEFLEKLLEPASDFIKNTGREIFCGEYGVIEYADYESTLCWYKDFVGLLNDMGIGHTAWSYVGFSTFMSDEPREVRYSEIVRIISSVRQSSDD